MFVCCCFLLFFFCIIFVFVFYCSTSAIFPLFLLLLNPFSSHSFFFFHFSFLSFFSLAFSLFFSFSPSASKFSYHLFPLARTPHLPTFPDRFSSDFYVLATDSLSVMKWWKVEILCMLEMGMVYSSNIIILRFIKPERKGKYTATLWSEMFYLTQRMNVLHFNFLKRKYIVFYLTRFFSFFCVC